MQHASHLCDCDTSERVLLYRLSLAEIEDLLQVACGNHTVAACGQHAQGSTTFPSPSSVKLEEVQEGVSSTGMPEGSPSEQAVCPPTGPEGEQAKKEEEVVEEDKNHQQQQQQQQQQQLQAESDGAEPGARHLLHGSADDSSHVAEVKSGMRAEVYPTMVDCVPLQKHVPQVQQRRVRGKWVTHADCAAVWVSRAKVRLRTPPTLETVDALLAEAQEFLWAGHEVDAVSGVARAYTIVKVLHRLCQ